MRPGSAQRFMLRSYAFSARPTYRLPAFSRGMSTRFRLWQGMANRANCRRCRSVFRSGGLSAVWGADDAKGLQVIGGHRRTLQGRKILASGAGFVTDPLVTAKADDGQVMCLLHLEMDEKVDLSGWNALGMRSTATGAIELSGIWL